MRIRNLTAAAVLGALLLPAAADAATKPVFRGPPPKGQLKGVKGPAFDSSFYPNRVTIATGDKIKLSDARLRRHDLRAQGPEGARRSRCRTRSAPVSGAKDAAGNDMWFNGRPAFAPNPAAIMPQGGTVIDGSKVVGSGLALDGPPKPWVVKFPKAGTYVLRSALQPGVTLTVKVTKKASKKTTAGSSQAGGGTTAASPTSADRRQLRANAKLANRLLKYKGPQGNVVARRQRRQGRGARSRSSPRGRPSRSATP